MIFPTLKPHFSRFLQAGGDRLHLAAHSHHLWPDVSFDAQAEAWLDAARLWDGKWEHIFATVIPEAQRHVARHLRLPDPSTIAFAANTHEFILRLLSALPAGRPARILTTDGEFHSFARQAARLEEEGMIDSERVPVQPFDDFPERFIARAAAGAHDLVFISQVFFGSGFAPGENFIHELARALPADTVIVIDGYHGFMARPADLSGLAQRVFYLAGGYKYAAAGEGVCFLHCPPGWLPRPRNTGWYAAFGALAATDGNTLPYGADYSRFMGATFDPSGLYRFNAVMRWMEEQGVDAAAAQARAQALQAGFVPAAEAIGVPALRQAKLLVGQDAAHARGNFLAYRAADAAMVHARLLKASIVTDVRGDVLRIGFGLYHDPADIPHMAARIARALRD